MRLPIFATALVAALHTTSASSATVTFTAGATQATAAQDSTSNGQTASAILVSTSKSRFSISNGSGAFDGVPVGSVGSMVGYLNASKATYPTEGGSVVNLTRVAISSRINPIGIIGIESLISELTIDQPNGDITQIGLKGGFGITSPYLTAIVNGGSFFVRNLKIDLTNRRVIADITTSPQLWDSARQQEYSAPSATRSNIALWTFDAPSGATRFPTSGLTSNSNTASSINGFTPVPTTSGRKLTGVITLPNLRMTPQGLDIFAAATQGAPGSTFDGLLRNYNQSPNGWGTMKINIDFQTGTTQSCQ